VLNSLWRSQGFMSNINYFWEVTLSFLTFTCIFRGQVAVVLISRFLLCVISVILICRQLVYQVLDLACLSLTYWGLYKLVVELIWWMRSGLVNLLSWLVRATLHCFLTRCICIKTSTQLWSWSVFVVDLPRESWCWLYLLFGRELADVVGKILHVCGGLRLKPWSS
jgi:hypothetical protein